jgi:hypothetical protein
MLNFPQKLMRPRRTLLASLAPLLGLSALMAVAAAGSGSPKQSGAQSHPLVRLIHSVFQLVSPSAESAAARSHSPGPPPRVFFELLTASLWLVTAPLVPASSPWRRRLQLRC